MSFVFFQVMMEQLIISNLTVLNIATSKDIETNTTLLSSYLTVDTLLAQQLHKVRDMITVTPATGFHFFIFYSFFFLILVIMSVH